MGNIKSYTDLEQSKKLAEILPIESADMVIWGKDLDAIGATDAQKLMKGLKDRKMNYIPCWSLSALLNYLREVDYFPEINADEFKVTMSISYYNEDEARPLAPVHNIKVKAESFIDACVEVILNLHKLNLL